MYDLIDRYRGKTAIFIADRNYENYNIFAHVEEKGMYYLIRVKDIHSTGILRSLDLQASCEFDVLQSLTLTKKQTKEVKTNRDKYKFVPSTSTFDYLDLHTNKFYDLNMRIVRFPITESTYECIITNLPQDQFSAEEIKQLYAKRWGIDFRELKYEIGLTRFHSKKLDYIMQEIWSRMTLYNSCEIITSSVIVEKNDNRKLTYQLNIWQPQGVFVCSFL